MLDTERQAIIDDEHLKLLSLGYIVSGVMSALMSGIGLLYAAMGLMVSLIEPAEGCCEQSGEAPPEFVGVMLGVVGGGIFVMLMSLAIAKFKTASYLKKRRARTFCMVVAAVSCLGMPWGTFLGVCTFIVLGRASVRQRFETPG